jgi:hypothetical protein
MCTSREVIKLTSDVYNPYMTPPATVTANNIPAIGPRTRVANGIIINLTNKKITATNNSIPTISKKCSIRN